MSKWIEEELEPGLRVSYGLNEILNSSKSKFQTVDVVDIQAFGRTLLIDGLKFSLPGLDFDGCFAKSDDDLATLMPTAWMQRVLRGLES